MTRSPASARRRGPQGPALLHDPAEKGFVRVVELGRRARRREVDGTIRPCWLNRIRSHATSGDPSRRASPRLHAKPRRARPQVPDASILRAFGKPPNLTGRIVRPNRHRLAHGKHPSVCHLESRHRRFGHPSRAPQSPGWYKAPRASIQYITSFQPASGAPAEDSDASAAARKRRPRCEIAEPRRSTGAAAQNGI
jgi:hypothetical protein